MDRRLNPYTPGAGLPPPELAGRDEAIAAFVTTLARVGNATPDRSSVLFGLRGVGKTVLLAHLQAEAESLGWATGWAEVEASKGLSRHVAEALRRSVRVLARRHRRAAAFRQLAAVVKAFALAVDPQGTVRFMVDIEAARGVADTGDLDEDLPELFNEASGAVIGLGLPGIVLFLDEIQEASIRDLSALSLACHAMGRTAGRVLVALAGLPYVPSQLAAAKSYAERLYHYVPVDRLSSEAARRAVTAPAERLGVRFDEGAVKALMELSDGYPYFLQAFGQASWNQAEVSPITTADVVAGQEFAQEELDAGFFGPRLERATPRQRDYLQAMAGMGDRVAAAAVAERLHAPPATLSPLRDALIKKGLIYSPERGALAFTVPHFGTYLRDRLR